MKTRTQTEAARDVSSRPYASKAGDGLLLDRALRTDSQLDLTDGGEQDCRFISYGYTDSAFYPPSSHKNDTWGKRAKAFSKRSTMCLKKLLVLMSAQQTFLRIPETQSLATMATFAQWKKRDSGSASLEIFLGLL